MAKAAKSTGDKSLDCLNLALKAAQYGPVRMQESIDAYHRFVDGNLADGMGLNDARPKAMQQVMDALDQSAQAKKLKLDANVKKLGEHEARIAEARATKPTLLASLPKLFYDTWLGTLQDVNWAKTARGNFTAQKDTALGNITSMFRGVVNDFSRNWAGVLRAPIDTAAIADEVLRPGSTGNQVAKDIAAALGKMYNYTKSELGLNGVMLKRTVGDELTFYPNPVRLEGMGLDAFKTYMKDNVDWTRSANGYFVRENERDAFLEKYFQAVTKDKWDDFPRPFEYTGGRFARDFNNQTIFKFKDGKTYAEAHSTMMDGDFLQTVTRQMEKHAFNIARAKVWGPNSDHMGALFKQMSVNAAKEAATSGKQLGKLNSLMRRGDAVFDMAMRTNAMDPESKLGMITNTTSNLMSGAMLHGALFTSVAGDLATMLANRIANNEALIAPLTAYMKEFLNPKTMLRSDMLAMGHSASDYLSQVYHTMHYSNSTAWGETIAKYMTDKTMRLNLMNRHFDIMRGADTRMRSQSLFNARFTSFDDLRERALLENNNITPAEWDKTRKAMTEHVYMPADDVSMFRPMDHFDTLGSNLAHKWQLMFTNESKRSVMETSLEARAMLMGGERPDTVIGVLRRSTGQFANYGITYGLSLSRALAHGNGTQRMGAFARLGVGAVFAAMIGQQAKNLWYGKELEPIDNVPFWLRMIATSAAGPWGSILTGGMRADSATQIIKAMGGPYAQFVGDTYSTFIGSAYQYMDMTEAASKWTAGKAGVAVLDYFRKYMIPETFYTSMALQRAVLEPMQESLDSSLMQQRFRAQIQNEAKYRGGFRPGYEPGSGTGILPGLGGR